MKSSFILCLLGVCCLGSVPHSQETAIHVAFQDILKTPSEYDGKLIETRGYLVHEFENSALYATQNWRGTQGIWITPGADVRTARDRANHHYVVVTGVYDAKDRGHLGGFEGTLNIRKVFVDENDKRSDSPGSQ